MGELGCGLPKENYAPNAPLGLLKLVEREFVGNEVQAYIERFFEEHHAVFEMDDALLQLPVECHEHCHAWHETYQHFVAGLEEELHLFLSGRGYTKQDFVREAKSLLVHPTDGQALLKL